jgi:hypothetical protein
MLYVEGYTHAADLWKGCTDSLPWDSRKARQKPIGFRAFGQGPGPGVLRRGGAEVIVRVVSFSYRTVHQKSPGLRASKLGPGPRVLSAAGLPLD